MGKIAGMEVKTIRHNRDILYIIAALLGLCVSGCLNDSVESPMPLSDHLRTLSYNLSGGDNCDDKREVLSKWLDEKSSMIEKDLAEFKTKCKVGDKGSFQCMSHQILAASQVEVALGRCVEDASMRDVIDRLNQKAGIAVGMTHDKPVN